jgi:hypothetical protein
LTRVEGDLQTTQQLLEAVKAKRFLAGSGQPRGADSADQLAAEEEGLKQRITALSDQAGLLRDRRQRLQLESPIAGQVLTWNATELLKSRPVQPGQRLVTVADPSGPWRLELEVADRDARHMLDAQASHHDPLQVEFTLATNPNIVYWGRLANVSARSESRRQQRPTVQVTVEIDAQQVQPLRPGSTVVAKIICGKRSAAYVWLHRVWESIQLYILF